MTRSGFLGALLATLVAPLARLAGRPQPAVIGYLDAEDPRGHTWVKDVFVDGVRVPKVYALNDVEGWVDALWLDETGRVVWDGAIDDLVRVRHFGAVTVTWRSDTPAWVYDSFRVLGRPTAIRG